MSEKVYVVFCMDTEGPCADPGNAELLADWQRVDAAMDKLFDEQFRSAYPDSKGGHFKVGWFFLTWTGFTTNPRGRDFGYHKVRDHYMERWGDKIAAYGDEHCWHYHQPSESGIGNEWGLDWTVSHEYENIISRQLLERRWFPVCYRAGGTVMDPISSRWVDAWFPVDYTNRAPLHLPEIMDWSAGVREWKLYHPDTENFRKAGAGRRTMARCLDLVTNVYKLDDNEIRAAFERAKNGEPAILSFFEHDYRDIKPRIEAFHASLTAIAQEYPEVEWEFAAPVEAVRKYQHVPRVTRLSIEALQKDNELRVWSNVPLYQSIPWIAVRTSDGEVHHIVEGVVRVDDQHWHWRIPAELDWQEIGIGGSTSVGEAAVFAVRRNGKPLEDFFERPIEEHPLYPRAIWEHSTFFPDSCVARSSGHAPETDSVAQAVDILADKIEPGASVLDVGCAAGHAWHSFKKLGVEYYGIDSYVRGIEIGRQYLAETGLPVERLRSVALENLPPSERYDAVVCLNTLNYFPMYHQPLEVMARAAKHWLVIRSNFGDEDEVRFLPDILLADGFHTMRAYYNVFSRDGVQEFLEREGFVVSWVADRRQEERFGGEPEVVGGVVFNYEFLVAERVAPVPTEQAILGEYFGKASQEWRESRAGGPSR